MPQKNDLVGAPATLLRVSSESCVNMPRARPKGALLDTTNAVRRSKRLSIARTTDRAKAEQLREAVRISAKMKREEKVAAKASQVDGSQVNVKAVSVDVEMTDATDGSDSQAEETETDLLESAEEPDVSIEEEPRVAGE